MRGCASAWERPGSLSVRRIEVLPSGRSRSASGCSRDSAPSVRPEQAVHFLDICLAKRSRGGLKLKAVHDRVIARLGQIAQRAVDLLLGVQDVDVDAHTDLVAELVRVERAPAGNKRRLKGLHLRHPVADPDVGLTGGQRGWAPRACKILLRLFPIGNGL